MDGEGGQAAWQHWIPHSCWQLNEGQAQDVLLQEEPTSVQVNLKPQELTAIQLNHNYPFSQLSAGSKQVEFNASLSLCSH